MKPRLHKFNDTELTIAQIAVVTGMNKDMVRKGLLKGITTTLAMRKFRLAGIESRSQPRANAPRLRYGAAT